MTTTLLTQDDLIAASDPDAPVLICAAGPEHIEPIWEMINESSRTTTVLPRALDSIRLTIGDFYVALQGGRVVACGSLVMLGPELAEVRSLVVAEGMRRAGLGGGIVRALIAEARFRSVDRLFTLTDNPGFFMRLGFEVADKATLPEKVWRDCLFCPKFTNCGETALDMDLEKPAPAGVPRGSAH